MEKKHDVSHIHILFLGSRAQSISLQILALAFLPFIVDLTFGKILNICENSHSRQIAS